jgi:hypothetical protein
VLVCSGAFFPGGVIESDAVLFTGSPVIEILLVSSVEPGADEDSTKAAQADPQYGL